MQFVQNVPFFSIMGAMVIGIATAMLPQRAAQWITASLCMLLCMLNAWLLSFMIKHGQSFHYLMGHFPAPWGNELRVGVLEALLATVFCFIMLLSVLGGMVKVREQVHHHKQHFFYIMIDLALASLLALIYTNDLFTAYVFIEILTIAGCTVIMARQNGRTLVGAMRYMIMSLLGSGLLLFAISLTYNLTGHLLMENIHTSIVQLIKTDAYHQPLSVIIGLFFVGLGIKSALFPFHTWLPDAYGYATPTASSIMSSLVSKGYLLLLVKIFYRVIGMDIIMQDRATHLLFVFGIVAMMMGSISAIRSHELRRMIAFSSVAQVGYIYAGLGLGTPLGTAAALYHLLMHSAAKSMLFISSSGLSDASDNSKRFASLRGSGTRYPAAGIAFTTGALSMVGIPLFGGFISKIYFSQAALGVDGVRMWILLAALMLSTLLNAFYFLHTVITLYRPAKDDFIPQSFDKPPLTTVALWGFVILNLLIGILAEPIISTIAQGLEMFA